MMPVAQTVLAERLAANLILRMGGVTGYECGRLLPR
jgi:hypothetical protein